MKKPDRMKQPQLFGDSRAAAQARRAAGVVLESEQEQVPIHIENQHPITAVKSARNIVRKMARYQKVPSRYIKVVTKLFRDHRRKVLGLIPEVIPESEETNETIE